MRNPYNPFQKTGSLRLARYSPLGIRHSSSSSRPLGAEYDLVPEMKYRKYGWRRGDHSSYGPTVSGMYFDAQRRGDKRLSSIMLDESKRMAEALVPRRGARNPELLIIGNPPYGLSMKQAKSMLPAGFILTKDSSGDYKVRRKGSPVGHGYFTNDLQDAIGTAKDMARRTRSYPSLYTGTNPRGRKNMRRRRKNHPLYVKRGKKFTEYGAARDGAVRRLMKSGKSRKYSTAHRRAASIISHWPIYHGMPGMHIDAMRIRKGGKRRRSCGHRVMPYVKIGGKKLHMTDLVKKYRNMKKAAQVWRAHRKYKAGKVVK
jgi:hypothetical protein